MSDQQLSPEDRDQLAAEFALGVLTGDDLATARSLLSSDSGFRGDVVRWSGRLLPMLDEVDPVEAPASLLARVEERTGTFATVHTLRRKVGMWRGVSAGAMALAASLALVMVVRAPQPEAPPAPARPPMVAMIGDDQTPARMVAAWDPQQKQLTVMSAAAAPAEPGHSHELWVIPADGKPRSLGVMPATRKMQMAVAEPMVLQIAEGVTLAVSLEPAGGSPTGAPTGPVIASGKLERA